MTEASAIRIAADGTLHSLGVAGAVAVDVDQLATDHPLTVVVPGADVLLCEVDLPPVRQAARRLQAARFALEERLATPVEDLHLVLGPRSAGGRYPVAVVAHERMEEWLQALGGAREAVVAMVPDYLCLPQPAIAETIAWCTDDEVLVRREALSGFACEASLCPLLLRPAQEPGRLILRANGHQALASELAGLGYSLSREDQTPPAVACQALLQQAALRPALNLWSGPYAASTDDNPWWRPLRATAALALVWLALATAAQALVYQDLSARLAGYETATRTSFRTAFPNVTNINDLRVQAQQKILQLRAQQGSGGFFPLLAATATATEAASGVSVRSLQYRDGELQLNLQGKTVGSVEALRNGFEQHPGVSLQIQSAEAGDAGVQIRARVSRSAS